MKNPVKSKRKRIKLKTQKGELAASTDSLKAKLINQKI